MNERLNGNEGGAARRRLAQALVNQRNTRLKHQMFVERRNLLPRPEDRHGATTGVSDRRIREAVRTVLQEEVRLAESELLSQAARQTNRLCEIFHNFLTSLPHRHRV